MRILEVNGKPLGLLPLLTLQLYPLAIADIATENGHLEKLRGYSYIYALRMVIFHSYACLPNGRGPNFRVILMKDHMSDQMHVILDLAFANKAGPENPVD